MMRKARRIAVLVYVAGAVPVWVGFVTAPPDGLANIWLFLYTLPVTAVCTFVMGLSFPYFRGGYYMAHSMYFLSAVGATAALLAGVIWTAERVWRMVRGRPG